MPKSIIVSSREPRNMTEYGMDWIWAYVDLNKCFLTRIWEYQSNILAN